MGEVSDIVIFLGRFHPLIVHLPIGFLLLAGIMEILSSAYKIKYASLNTAISISMLCGALGAVASAIIGYMLSKQGGYESNTLFWHQWLGILLAVLSFLGWAIKSGKINIPFISSKTIIILLIVLISITGHLGGNLTHGSDYLTAYAPEFLKGDEEKSNFKIPSNPDSIVVFKHLIQPILNNKCISCHNDTKSNGGLNLTNTDKVNDGGDNGMVITPFQPYNSELFLRSTFPESSKKFMPPKGTALTFTELKLLEWWIAEGASFDGRLLSYKFPKELKNLFERDFKLNTKKRPYYETVKSPKLDEQIVLELSEQGWLVNPLSAEHHMLDVKFFDNEITLSAFETLEKAKEQITWLDISKSGLTDDLLKRLSAFKNLTYLNIHKSNITDEGVKHIETLAHLEVLNLYNTEITDKSIIVFAKLPSLKRVYLWNTKITKKAIEELYKENPNLKIISN
ncbi:putative membrane protein [Maribacter vaceletii]|uniref:Putative membrane protein n=1 Tax=Maribacter vaceletii TaxID=1206816 RepID=A0A495EB08_9FLAO|nr:c-type cytochrome domain-containing protein [Maribacter vaceletii]RKR14084.1 putative membrane protein [Maribacter vaceletii]